MVLENDPELQRWIKSVEEDLVPKVKSSFVVASIIPNSGSVDAKFSVELGVSIMLDKPIIAIVRPGTQIPRKLAAVVDRFVEMDSEHPEKTSDSIAETMRELTEELRNQKHTDGSN